MNDAVAAFSANHQREIIAAAVTATAVNLTATSSLSMTRSKTNMTKHCTNVSTFSPTSAITVVAPSSMAVAINNFNAAVATPATTYYYGTTSSTNYD